MTLRKIFRLVKVYCTFFSRNATAYATIDPKGAAMATTRDKKCSFTRPDVGLGRIAAAVACLACAAVVATAAPSLIDLGRSELATASDPQNTTGKVTEPTATETVPPEGPAQDLTKVASPTAMLVRNDVETAQGNRIGYTPDQAVDGRLDTAWAIPGDGTDRALYLTFETPVIVKSVGLVNGYAKIDSRSGADRYEENRRVAKVSWFADDALVREQFLTDGERSMQTISLKHPVKAQKLALVIDRTWEPGNPAQDDTAISEVTVTGWQTP